MLFFGFYVYFCTKIANLTYKNSQIAVNYEELLESKNGASMKKMKMPFGVLYKTMIDGSYANMLDLREDLIDNLRFCDALKSECEQVKSLNNQHQLHFRISTDSPNRLSLVTEAGNYMTLERLLADSPAMVAEKDFVEHLLADLAEVTTYLNEQNIFHLCFSPSNILVRKGKLSPMLLLHGSPYLFQSDLQTFYGQEAITFVAPEVLEKGAADSRSEVYSLGKLLEELYRDSDVPFEYKQVIKKATDNDPQKRYQTASQLVSAMHSRRTLRSSLIMGAAAVVVALLCMYVYFEFLPKPEVVEFVEPALDTHIGTEEEFAEGYDPMMDLGVPQRDSSNIRVNEKKIKEYEAKAEQIFRKRYAEQAERILSKIYDNDHMNDTEKNFLVASSSVMEELTKLQIDLGSKAGLSDAKSQRIASEIIEKISNAKKAEIKSNNKE
jgi:serine/threonine protein kinase